MAQAQDRLRALILDPRTPDFWNTTFETSDPPSLATSPVDVDAAVAKAMSSRLDLQQARKQLESNDVRLKYFKNQTLPDVSAIVNYGLAGLGGTVLNRGRQRHRSGRSHQHDEHPLLRSPQGRVRLRVPDLVGRAST